MDDNKLNMYSGPVEEDEVSIIAFRIQNETNTGPMFNDLPAQMIMEEANSLE